MGNIETQPKRNIIEDGFWYLKIGGLIAAAIGFINSSALIAKGLIVAGIGHIGETEAGKH